MRHPRYGRDLRGGYDGGLRETGGYGRPFRASRPAGGYDAEPFAGSPYDPDAVPVWPAFIPYGWNPMARWSGWDPGMGAVPYAPHPAAYGRGPGDGYGREYDRGFTSRGRGYDRAARGGRPGGSGRGYDGGFAARGRGGYGRDFYPAGRPVHPRRSGTWGMDGDRVVREWARGHGYGMEFTIEPRPGRR